MTTMFQPYCPIRVRSKAFPKGKIYTVPEPSVTLGLKITKLLSEKADLSHAEEYKLLEEMCGPVWAEWYDDGVSHSHMYFGGRAVMTYFMVSPKRAADYVSGGPVDSGNPIPPRWIVPRSWRWTRRHPASSDQMTLAEAPSFGN